MLNEYQRQALNTLSDEFHFDPHPNHCRLLHAAIGVATEGGELLDALKKAIYYHKPLDALNLKEELGDIMWYVAVGCAALGTTIDEVCAMNIAKLRARYPHRFTCADAIHRNAGDERSAMRVAESENETQAVS